MTRTHDAFFERTQQVLPLLREARPLVQCLTNSVTTNFVANVLLALGASPAMADVPDEAAVMARTAGAVLVNLGTPSGEQRQAMLEAAVAAHESATPWVLDPVGVGALPVRTALATRLVELCPSVIRGNASEIRALAGQGAGARGVDSVDDVDDAREAAVALARSANTVVAVSGQVDLITDGSTIVRVENGDPLFTSITGAGCALGAAVAAFAATHEDLLTTTVAACVTYAVAGELAACGARGPGSFSVGLLDSLATIDASAVAARARLS